MRVLEKLVYSKACTENQSPIGPIHPSKARNKIKKENPRELIKSKYKLNKQYRNTYAFYDIIYIYIFIYSTKPRVFLQIFLLGFDEKKTKN